MKAYELVVSDLLCIFCLKNISPELLYPPITISFEGYLTRLAPVKHLCDQLFASNSALVKMFLMVSEISFLKLKPDPDIPIILIVFLSLTG